MAIKDSGKREQFESGMVRDVTEGKTDYLLTRDGPMFERWAKHLTAGALKYDRQNWMLASGETELERFRISAARHFEQALRGDTDEDHFAAVFFNLNGIAYVLEQIEKTKQSVTPVIEVLRRAIEIEQYCPARGNWYCERPKGHAGKHMAWERYVGPNHPDNQLYFNGVWE